jgi:hypothetical protein
MPGWKCGRQAYVLFGQFHLKLNGVQVAEPGLPRDEGQSWITVGDRLVQPCKGAIGLATVRQHGGSVIGPVLFVLADPPGPALAAARSGTRLIGWVWKYSNV